MSIKGFKEKWKKLLVATTKPEVFAIEVLKHFKLYNYFEYVAGSYLDGRRVDKGELIGYALESAGIEDLGKVIMVGDRRYDIIGAKKVGIDSIGVLYGFGDKKELQDAGADYIVELPEDIPEILI